MRAFSIHPLYIANPQLTGHFRLETTNREAVGLVGRLGMRTVCTTTSNLHAPFPNHWIKRLALRSTATSQERMRM